MENELRKKLPFWDRISAAQQRELSAHTTPCKYAAGQNLHSAGNQCVGVLLVKSGELRTYIMSGDGREITLYRLSEGGVCILSASCVLHNITFDVFVDAERDTELLMVNAAYFSGLLAQNIYAENYALKIAADAFSEVMWTMEQILFMRFDQRLAIFLLDETARLGSDLLPLIHEQIARYMGSAREVVSRMLKYFEKEGIVKLSRGAVEVVDKSKLKAIAV